MPRDSTLVLVIFDTQKTREFSQDENAEKCLESRSRLVIFPMVNSRENLVLVMFLLSETRILARRDENSREKDGFGLGLCHQTSEALC